MRIDRDEYKYRPKPCERVGCGEVFIPKNVKAKYCSDNCRRLVNNENVTRFRRNHPEWSRAACKRWRDKNIKLQRDYRIKNREKLNKQQQDRRQKLKAELNKSLGIGCLFNNDIDKDRYHRGVLTLHEKSGNGHKGKEAILLALENPNGFVKLCSRCHQSVHWLMEVFEMEWVDIERINAD
jgi:hypothetical protein